MAADQTQPKRHRFDATVHVVQPICREHALLTLSIDADQHFPSTRPGQFIQLGCRPPGQWALGDCEFEWKPRVKPDFHQPENLSELAFLRRPFSLAGRTDTTEAVHLNIIYRVVGVGTAWLDKLEPGDPIDLIGPLGNGFDLPAGKSIALLVGGGVGLPPMFYLARAIHDAGWAGCAFVGATTRDLLAVNWTDQPPDPTGQPTRSVQQFDRCSMPAVVTTDDGSAGLRGLITNGLRRYLADQPADQRAASIIYTCGPEPMMKAVAQLAAEFGLDCQVCLEQNMACGMGTCQSCIVRIRDEASPQAHADDGTPWRYRLTCTDGPVFDAAQVVW